MNKEVNKSRDFLRPSEELPPIFVGREKELSNLNRAFFQTKSKVIVVTGKTGVGKTALILEFVRQHKNKFPGGIYHIPQISSLQVFNKALTFIHQSSEPILVIFEESGSVPPKLIVIFLSTILNERPSAKILLTSQLPSFTIISESFGHLVDTVIKLEIEDSIRSQRFRADLTNLNIEDSFHISTQPFARPSIIGPDGHPLSKNNKSYKQIVTDISEVSDELLRKLYRNPELLNELSARKFEEVIAEILHRQGYEVEITPFSKDGGKDICAAKKDSLGTFLYIVQCKKYAPNRPVGVEIVRELYGVVQVEEATAGIIATTSYFTKGAKNLQSQLLYRISLKDYIEIQEWLKSILG